MFVFVGLHCQGWHLDIDDVACVCLNVVAWAAFLAAYAVLVWWVGK